MFTMIEEDMVSCSGGTEQHGYDKTVKEAASKYRKANSQQIFELKKYYYAIIVHGWAGESSVGAGEEQGAKLDPFEFAGYIAPAYYEKGRSRAILLISCFGGMATARALSTYFRTGAVGAKAEAIVKEGGILSTQSSSEESRNPAGQDFHMGEELAWIFVSRSNFINLGGPDLDIARAIRLAKPPAPARGANVW